MLKLYAVRDKTTNKICTCSNNPILKYWENKETCQKVIDDYNALTKYFKDRHEVEMVELMCVESNQIIEKDVGYLSDWYQNSIDDTKPPVWTDEHIEELLEDFILIPRLEK